MQPKTPRVPGNAGMRCARLLALPALFHFYAAGGLIADMIEDLHATSDERYAVGARFTLLVWGFICSSWPCRRSDPESPRSWTELIVPTLPHR